MTMEGLKTIPYLFLLLAIAGIIAGATALVISKFQSTVDDCTAATATYNASAKVCQNSSQHTVGSVTVEYQTMLDSAQAQANVSEQLPTIGIITIMVVIIAVIAGVFVYIQYFK